MPLDYIDPNGDIVALARAAGYLPNDGGSGDPSAAPDAAGTGDINGLSDPAPPPMSGGLTPPTYVPDNMGPASAPQTPPLSSMGASVGAGMGYRGFNGGAYGRVSKTEGDLQKDLAAADAMAASGANQQAAVAGQWVPGARQAATDQAHAMAEKATQDGRNAVVMQRLQDDFAADEARINAESQAASNQAKADYVAALADFRAAKVDPAQLWHNMNGGERFGMLASAFVHDFLGAKGINTSAMSTFNKAIDRNIDAQIQAIKTKGEVAEGFKSLWYMQRNQSASDAEARARVRGFLLEGTKQQVIANMAQYESALATAQGQSAVAAIDKELSTTLIEVYRHADANAIQLRNQAIDKWKAKLQASIEQQNVSLRAQELAQRKKEAAPKETNPWATYIPDTSASGGGKIRYQIIAGSTPKQDELREQIGAISNFDDQMGQFTALMRKIKSTAPGTTINALEFMRTPEGARLIQLRNSMARSLAYAKSGKQVNKEEFDHFVNQMPIESWITNGGRETIWAQTSEILRNEAFSKLAPFVREIGDNETITAPDGSVHKLREIAISPHFNAPGEVPTGVPGEAAAIENHAIISPPPKGMEERTREEANKYLRPADKGESISGDTDLLTEGIVDAKTAFLKENPDFATKDPAAPEPSALEKLGTVKRTGEPGPTKGVPISRSDKGLMMLARAAQGGDPKAMAQLKMFAGEYINKGVRDQESMFAAYLLNSISPGSGDSLQTGE